MYKSLQVLFFGSISLTLAGCVGDPSANYGLSPVLRDKAVAQASARKQNILLALREDAEFNLHRQVNWYDVTVAGFNFIDDQCTTYFNRLFKLDRNKNAIKSGINAFDKTTNAILTATGSQALSLTIVAQAFGLATSLVDAYSGTFLYSLPPSETSRFVRELQLAYRNGISAQRAAITSPAETYHQLQEYLNICQPQTIEARLIERVSNTSASAVATASGVEVVIGDQLGLETRTVVVEEKHKETLKQAQRITRSLSSASEAATLENTSNNSVFTLGTFEPTIPEPRIRAFQRALCVTVDGRMGPTTRAAIVEFYKGANEPRPLIATNGLTSGDLTKLDQAIARYPRCSAQTHMSARQLGQLVATAR